MSTQFDPGETITGVEVDGQPTQAPPAPAPKSLGPGGGSPLARPDLGQPDPNVEMARKGFEKYQAKSEQDYEEGEKRLAPQREKLLGVLNSPVKAQAHLKEVQEQPKPEDYRKGAMEFAASMAVVGAIFGRGSRNAGNAALNAFAGAMKGWKEGNLEAYTQATKEWEEATKKTIENNNLELEKYRMIIEDKKLNIDQMSAAYNIVADEFKNKVTHDQSMAKDYTGFLSTYDKQMQATARLQRSLDQQKLLDTQGRVSVEKILTDPDRVNEMSDADLAKAEKYAQENNITLPKPKGISLEEKKYLAEQVRLLGPQAISGLGYGAASSGLKREIMGMAAQSGIQAGQSPGENVANRADVKGLSSALTDLEKQKAAIKSFQGFTEKNGDYLVQIAKKVDQTGVPVVERWTRAGRKSVQGDPDVAEFDAQLRAYANDVARIITNPTMKGVLSNQAREEVASFLPESAAYDQIVRLHQLFKRDFGNRNASVDGEIARLKAQISQGGSAPAGGESTAASSNGGGARPRARNPKTGAEVEWDGTQWQPVK